MDNKKMRGKQNDHLIIPKSTLMRFIDSKTKNIYYLDLSNPEKLAIKQHFPKSFHTLPNFYLSEYDDVVKKHETTMGEIYCLIAKTESNGGVPQIDARELKDDILNILNIQFQRVIIADEDWRTKTIGKLCNNYKQGVYSHSFFNKKDEFKRACEDPTNERFYIQQCLCGKMNSGIKAQYGGFKPYILKIPNEVKSTFILSPTNFVSPNMGARIILSPRIAIALYPKLLPDENEIVRYLTKEEVDNLFPRTIESALMMNEKFRQVIGEKNYLEYIKEKLEFYKIIMYDLPNNITLVNCDTAVLCSGQAFLELAVALQLYRPCSYKIIIGLKAVSDEFVTTKEFEMALEMLEKWHFSVVFLKDGQADYHLKNHKSVRSIEEALAMFSLN